MAFHNWDRVESIFLSAADLPPGERTRFLDDACDTAELRKEVESLLAADQTGSNPIASAVGHAAVLFEKTDLAEQRLGPYKIEREIGSGGMGAVYLAVRDDDQYRKKVAIKLIRRGMDTAEMLGRFRHERQILANLEHPCIARLLDGGSAPDGRPFLVMEYIEGQPLDDYCRERNPGLRERCRLFLMVCGAVSHAHRNLVVHRDLKPGNILVGSDGSPKLLDFGVAKLLDADAASPRTMALGAVPLTPHYASPEQVRGESVTTATDVYALGTVLYELLTGERAQKISSPTPREIERVVCETEPKRPSLAARAAGLPWKLDADLDNIVARAMHKDPARRYQSADALREDLERQLSGFPIAARRDSIAYRCGKFLRRNVLPVAAAAAVLVSIVAGALLALQQARVASAQREIAVRERDRAEQQRAAAQNEHALALKERDRAEAESSEARAQRARAQKRLQDIVELANTSFYGVEEALARQAGTAELRRNVVATSLEYLDKLAVDAANDPDLALAIAAGYMKMGDVLGRSNAANLGDRPGALKSYRKAWSLLDGIRAAKGGREASLLWIEVGNRIGVELTDNGAYLEAIATMDKVLLEARNQVARNADDRALELQAMALKTTATAYSNRMSNKSVELGKASAAVAEKLVARHPDNLKYLNSLQGSYSDASIAMQAMRDYSQGLEYAKRAVSVSETLVSRKPDDVAYQNNLMMSNMRVADAVGGHYYRGPQADHVAALAYYRKSLAAAKRLLDGEPNSPLNRNNYGLILTRAGAVAPSPAGREESLRMLTEAVPILEEALKRNPQSFVTQATINLNYQYQARRLEEMGRFDQAIEAAKGAIESADALVKAQPTNANAPSLAMSPRETLSKALARAGRREEALAAAREAIERATFFATKGPQPERLAMWPARAQEWLGSVHWVLSEGSAASDHRGNARRAWEASRDLWKPLLGRSILGSPETELARVEGRLREAGTEASTIAK